MARLEEIKTISIQIAMDNLAAIVSIDMANPPRIGIIQNNRLVTNAEEIGSQEVFWLSGEGGESILEIYDMTVRSIHHHLVALLESREVNWEDPKVRQGIQAMITLVAEAAHKLDAYLAFRLGKPLEVKAEQRIPYQDLQFFYQHRFSRQFKGGLDTWVEAIVQSDDSLLLMEPKTGLMDFETVRRDLEYELFSIRNENGEPYFNAELLRNIKLACFTAGSEPLLEDDPLMRIRSIEDRDLQGSSQQILAACAKEIESFYRLFKKNPDNQLAKNISQAVMALFLTANTRNLIQNTVGKSCCQYFKDFQHYLRLALQSGEYQKYIAALLEKNDPLIGSLLDLSHKLCNQLFYRLGGVKEEILGLVHRCMRMGAEKDHELAIVGDTLWNQLLIDDEKFRVWLGQFPNGPLLKILDQIREEETIAFDPLIQGNIPQQLGKIIANDRTIHVLRMPCPVRQASINQVEIADEFIGFIRFYGEANLHKRHLFINLQDRTSWQEYARSLSVESFSKRAEFKDALVVATLTKHSDFYHQTGAFMNIDNAKLFIEEFTNELSRSEECGFFFPTELSGKEQKKFIQAALAGIHRIIFEKRSELNRQNREDFVEIFYQFLILKWIEKLSIDSISFTCKDGVDIGAAAVATFMGFLQIIQTGDVKDIEMIRYLLYAPALCIRERAIDPERLGRSLSALGCISQAYARDPKAFGKELKGLYKASFIESIALGPFDARDLG